ncbi:DUF2461 domain-containing protein [Robertkochia flava]|uniref:DUF2461 domain-containing protein n=1 Tax=Robertkochia flava TaxID=3447986 RepID=UPI001CC969E1|nr:DUF2461 domain-containing protein [Robertkochia marina]
MDRTTVPVSVLQYLKELKINNNREWFDTNKKHFKKEQKQIKAFFEDLFSQLQSHDEVDQYKVFRIYRDIRFSKDKTPYKTHFSASFHRTKPKYRGGYYLHIEPGKSFLAAGFWNPEKDDLLRIRKEFEIDDAPMRKFLSSEAFEKIFNGLEGEELKTAPKGFDRDHPAIDLIRKKQYIVTRKFTDAQVIAPGFPEEVNQSFAAIRPWFNYMSEVLTTDLNGVSLLE